MSQIDKTSAPVTPYEQQPHTRGAHAMLKSGPLYISSRGLGWKTWKRRWFILTRNSLFFHKSDPNVPPTKIGETNLVLGGIDLNNSGSVLVRADKKLLTLLFPDGRAFTLKAETTEDLDEWKAALERALILAPNPQLMGQSGIFRHDSVDAGDGLLEQGRERRPIKSLVVGRPILLALEDIDGSPSFLEKALCFIEQYGVKVEGILRQSADVDDVDLRIRDYEHGRNEFGIDEDAHVISDCVKHVLRELPSSPVPTPCCTALLEAHRIEVKEARILAMRVAVAETFPEPNRRLLQRILKMMGAVVNHSSENRMTTSAVAACMAPLLLRPLLAGECGLEDDSDVSGDNAAQLLAAAAAANSAQAIITTLLEDYEKIFQDQSAPSAPSFDIYPNAEDSVSESSSEEEVLEHHDGMSKDNNQELDVEIDEDADRPFSQTFSESSSNEESNVHNLKAFEMAASEVESAGVSSATSNKRNLKDLHQFRRGQRTGNKCISENNGLNTLGKSAGWEDAESSASTMVSKASNNNGRGKNKLPSKDQGASCSKRTSIWSPPSVGKRTLSTEGNDLPREEELAIMRLEATRQELRNKIAKEIKGNAALQASLERRKQALHERRMTLEQDLARLQGQLQTERDLRAALELGLSIPSAHLPLAANFDKKTRAELEEIALVEADVARLKQKVSKLNAQLNQQRLQQGGLSAETNERYQRVKNLQAQQKILQQELDQTLALCQHEKQRNIEIEGQHGTWNTTSTLEEVILHQRNALAEAKESLKAERTRGEDLRRRVLQPDAITTSDWRKLQPPSGPSSSGRQLTWRHGVGSNHGDNLVNNDTTMAIDTHQLVPSCALMELTTRLDFFKERRSQLMEQLNNLDLTISPPSVNGSKLLYTSSSPSWTRQP